MAKIDVPLMVMKKKGGTYNPYIKCFIKVPNEKNEVEIISRWGGGNQFRNFDDIIHAFKQYKIKYPGLKINSNGNDLELRDEKWANGWGEYSKEDKEVFIKENYI